MLLLSRMVLNFIEAELNCLKQSAEVCPVNVIPILRAEYGRSGAFSA